MSSCGEAQTKLSTDHHGLVDAPVLTADGAPTPHSSDLHQHLHAALWFLSASCQTHLKVQGGERVSSCQVCEYGYMSVCLHVCLFSCVSHRGLHAGVGDVAADRYILAVFAGVKWHRSVATLGDRLLPACTLHAVHVDGTGAYRRRTVDWLSLTNYKPHARQQPAT